MSQVHGNPEEIRDFARQIGTFASETLEQIQALNAHLRDLGDTQWNDQKYAEFSSDFEQVHNAIRQALQTLNDEHVIYLNGLAQTLEEYESYR